MATSKEYAHFVESQFRGLDGFSMRPMFGEYAIYLKGRVLGFLADEQILLQDTPSMCRLMPEAERRELFPGSKKFVVFADEGNAHLLKSVSDAIWEELPLPKPRKRTSVHAAGKASLTEEPQIKDFLEFYRSSKEKNIR